MKRICMMLFAIALMSISAYAQKISADKVPATVISAFKAKYPAATKVEWVIVNTTDFKAEFLFNGEGYSANFDNTGKWLESEMEIIVNELPAVITTAMAKDFSGFRIKAASKVESIKNGKGYKAVMEKGSQIIDVLYSADGKLLSQTK